MINDILIRKRKHPTLPVWCFSDGCVQAFPANPRVTTRVLCQPGGNTHTYYGCHLNVGGKRKFFVVHRLIADTFLPNPNGLPCIDHINRDTHDNRVENLRWATYETNGNNTIRQISAATDNAHVSHVKACKKYYRKMKDAGFIKKRIKEGDRIIQRWVKEIA